jgi:predicted nucleic acid-binding protein
MGSQSKRVPMGKRSVARRKIRALRKTVLIEQGSLMAKLAKAKLILRGKGRNGMSMDDAMVAAHGIQRKGDPTP